MPAGQNTAGPEHGRPSADQLGQSSQPEPGTSAQLGGPSKDTTAQPSGTSNTKPPSTGSLRTPEPAPNAATPAKTRVTEKAPESKADHDPTAGHAKPQIRHQIEIEGPHLHDDQLHDAPATDPAAVSNRQVSPHQSDKPTGETPATATTEGVTGKSGNRSREISDAAVFGAFESSRPNNHMAQPGDTGPVAANQNHHDLSNAPSVNRGSVEEYLAKGSGIIDDYHGIVSEETGTGKVKVPQMLLGWVGKKESQLNDVEKGAIRLLFTTHRGDVRAPVSAGREVSSAESAAVSILKGMEQEIAIRNATATAFDDSWTALRKSVLIGTEFTFAHPKIAGMVVSNQVSGSKEKRQQENLRNFAGRLIDQWVDRVRSNARTLQDINLRVEDVDGAKKLTYTNKDGETWWWAIGVDDNCLETQTMPSPAAKFENGSWVAEIVDNHIFKQADSLGLKIDKSVNGGGGHLSIDSDTSFGSSVELFLATVKSIQDGHREWKEAFRNAEDPVNTPWLNDLRMRDSEGGGNALEAFQVKVEELLADVRAGHRDMSAVVDELTGFNEKLVNSAVEDIGKNADTKTQVAVVKSRPSHYQATNVEHMTAGDPSHHRLELRDIPAQRNRAELLDHIRHVFDRLQNVRSEVRIEQQNRIQDQQSRRRTRNAPAHATDSGAASPRREPPKRSEKGPEALGKKPVADGGHSRPASDGPSDTVPALQSIPNEHAVSAPVTVSTPGNSVGAASASQAAAVDVSRVHLSALKENDHDHRFASEIVDGLFTGKRGDGGRVILSGVRLENLVKDVKKFYDLTDHLRTNEPPREAFKVYRAVFSGKDSLSGSGFHEVLPSSTSHSLKFVLEWAKQRGGLHNYRIMEISVPPEHRVMMLSFPAGYERSAGDPPEINSDQSEVVLAPTALRETARRSEGGATIISVDAHDLSFQDAVDLIRDQSPVMSIPEAFERFKNFYQDGWLQQTYSFDLHDATVTTELSVDGRKHTATITRPGSGNRVTVEVRHVPPENGKPDSVLVQITCSDGNWSPKLEFAANDLNRIGEFLRGRVLHQHESFDSFPLPSDWYDLPSYDDVHGVPQNDLPNHDDQSSKMAEGDQSATAGEVHSNVVSVEPSDLVLTSRSFPNEDVSREFLRGDKEYGQFVLAVNAAGRENGTLGDGCGPLNVQLAKSIQRGEPTTEVPSKGLWSLNDLVKETNGTLVGPFHDNEPVVKLLLSSKKEYLGALVARKNPGSETGHITFGYLTSTGKLAYLDATIGNFADVLPIDPSIRIENLVESGTDGIRAVLLPRNEVSKASSDIPPKLPGNGVDAVFGAPDRYGYGGRYGPSGSTGRYAGSGGTDSSRFATTSGRGWQLGDVKYLESEDPAQKLKQFNFLADPELKESMRGWFRDVSRRLKVVRSLTGDSVGTALARPGGEINVPFETPLIVAIEPGHSDSADARVKFRIEPEGRPAGVGSLSVGLAAETISTATHAERRKSMFIFALKSAGQPDLGVLVASEIAMRNPGLVVRTTAGVTFAENGKLVVMDNAGLVEFTAQVERNSGGGRSIVLRKSIVPDSQFSDAEQGAPRPSRPEDHGPDRRRPTESASGPSRPNRPESGSGQHRPTQPGPNPAPGTSSNARSNAYKLLNLSEHAKPDLRTIEQAYRAAQIKAGLNEAKLGEATWAFELLTADLDRRTASDEQAGSRFQHGDRPAAKEDRGNDQEAWRRQREEARGEARAREARRREREAREWEARRREREEARAREARRREREAWEAWEAWMREEDLRQKKEEARRQEEARQKRANVLTGDYLGHYKALGLTPNATQAEIKNSYKKLALELHSDKTIHLKEQERIDRKNRLTEKVNPAYKLLSDPVERQKYDDKSRLEDIRAEMKAKAKVPGRGGASSASAGSRSRHPDPDVFSQENFAGDPQGEAEFLRETGFGPFMNLNNPRNSQDVEGRDTNCLPVNVGVINASRHPERAQEFRANPSGVVDPNRVSESGLGPLVENKNGFDDVIKYVREQKNDGVHQLVYVFFGGDEGHFITVHKRNGNIIFFDGQARWNDGPTWQDIRTGRLAVLGDPVSVWSAPVSSDPKIIFTPIYSPVGTRSVEMSENLDRITDKADFDEDFFDLSLDEPVIEGPDKSIDRHPAESNDTYLRDGLHSVKLDPARVRAWLAEHEITYPLDGGVAQTIAVYVGMPKDMENAPPPRVYHLDEAARFRDVVRRLAGQHHLAEQQRIVLAMNGVVESILRDYPPDRFSYVGVGRSPAPVIAALQGRGHYARSVPLSSFRPSPPRSSILQSTFKARGEPLPTKGQIKLLREHFVKYLGDLPKERAVLLIDYAQSGLSLISTQFYLQRHLNHLADGSGQAVHALAMYGRKQEEGIDSVYQKIVGDESLDPLERANWKTHFALLRLSNLEFGDASSSAFGNEGFDGLAEHGSYKILEEKTSNPKPPESRPQDGYRLLQKLVSEAERGMDPSKAAYFEKTGAQKKPPGMGGSLPANLVSLEHEGRVSDSSVGTTWDPTAQLQDWEPAAAAKDWDPAKAIEGWNPADSAGTRDPRDRDGGETKTSTPGEQTSDVDLAKPGDISSEQRESGTTVDPSGQSIAQERNTAGQIPTPHTEPAFVAGGDREPRLSSADATIWRQRAADAAKSLFGKVGLGDGTRNWSQIMAEARQDATELGRRLRTSDLASVLREKSAALESSRYQKKAEGLREQARRLREPEDAARAEELADEAVESAKERDDEANELRAQAADLRADSGQSPERPATEVGGQDRQAGPAQPGPVRREPNEVRAHELDEQADRLRGQANELRTRAGELRTWAETLRARVPSAEQGREARAQVLDRQADDAQRRADQAREQIRRERQLRGHEVGGSPDSGAVQAAAQRPVFQGGKGVPAIRAAILARLDADSPYYRKFVEVAASDENLIKAWEEVADGQFTISLGEQANDGDPEFRIRLLRLGQGRNVRSIRLDRESSNRRFDQRTSSIKSLPLQHEPFVIFIPTGHVSIRLWPFGIFNSRRSNLSVARSDVDEIKVVQRDVEHDEKDHTAIVEIECTSPGKLPWSGSRSSFDQVAIEVTLAWPKEKPAATEERPVSSTDRELTLFSNLGAVYDAVSAKVGGFAPNDVETRKKLEDWLTSKVAVDALLTGKVVRDTFDFAGKGKTPVYVAIAGPGAGAPLKSRPVWDGEGSVQHIQTAGMDVTHTSSLGLRRGGGIAVTGGDITGGNDGGLGGVQVRFHHNSDLRNGDTVPVTGGLTHTYSGPLQVREADVTLIVSVGEPMPGIAGDTSRSRGSAARHVPDNLIRLPSKATMFLRGRSDDPTPQDLRDKLGLTEAAQSGLQSLVDRHGVVVDVRPAPPLAARWIAGGETMPRPAEIPDKLIDEADVLLGAPADKIGLVGHFKPVLPDVGDPRLADLPGGLERLESRFAERLTEFRSGMPAGDRYRVTGEGVVEERSADGKYRPLTDHSTFGVRSADDHPLPAAERDRFLSAVRASALGSGPGSMRSWEQGSQPRRSPDGQDEPSDGVRFQPRRSPVTASLPHWAIENHPGEPAAEPRDRPAESAREEVPDPSDSRQSSERQEPAPEQGTPEADDPADTNRHQAPYRLDAKVMLAEADIEHLTELLLHRLNAEGVIGGRAGFWPKRLLRYPDASALPKLKQKIVDHLRKGITAREIRNGGDGIRIPLGGNYRGVKDLFVRFVENRQQASYLGSDKGERLEHLHDLGRSQMSDVEESRYLTAGIVGGGYADKQSVWPSAEVSVKRRTGHSDAREKERGNKSTLSSKNDVHYFRYPGRYQVSSGGRWGKPKPAHEWLNLDTGADDSGIPGSLLVAVPGLPTGYRTTADRLAAESRISEEAEPAWNNDDVPKPVLRQTDLPPSAELVVFRPLPNGISTAAKMLNLPRQARWKAWLKFPLIGREAKPIDKHHDRVLLVADDGGSHSAGEHDGALDGLEVFFHPLRRMALTTWDHIKLTTRNTGGLFGNRERNADVELSVERADPRIIDRIEDYDFSEVTHGADTLVDGPTKGVGATVKLSVGDFEQAIPPWLLAGHMAAIIAKFTQVWEKRAQTGGRREEKPTSREAAILVSTHVLADLSIKESRRWNDSFGGQHDGTVHAKRMWIHDPRGEVWVMKASEAHLLKGLPPEDLAKLNPEEAARYREKNPPGQEAQDAETSPEDRQESVGGESSGPAETAALRPPRNVGHGTGSVSFADTKARREFGEEVMRRLTEWSRHQGARVQAENENSPVKRAADWANQIIYVPRGDSQEPVSLKWFDQINDGLYKNVLKPDLTTNAADMLLLEAINGGVSILRFALTPVGRVEQLVVIRGKLGESTYHGSVEKRGLKQDVEVRWGSSGKKAVTAVLELAAGGHAYNKNDSAGNLNLFAVKAEMEQSRETSTAQEITDAISAVTEQRKHLEFLHPGEFTIYAYPLSAAGTYTKLVGKVLPSVEPHQFADPWEEHFTLPQSIRTTVDENLVIREGDRSAPPLARGEGLWQYPQTGKRTEYGFALDDEGRTVAYVNVHPFDAEKRDEVLRELFTGRFRNESGSAPLMPNRPAMPPRSIDKVFAATGLHRGPLHVLKALTRNRDVIKFPKGSPLKEMRIGVDFADIKLIGPVKDGPLDRSATEKQTVSSNLTRHGMLQSVEQHDLRGAPVDDVAQRPGGGVAELVRTVVDRTVRHDNSASTERKLEGPGGEPAEARYEVEVTPRWSITPIYRGKKARWLGWNRTIHTGRDNPITLEVDRRGLEELGLRVPGTGTGEEAPKLRDPGERGPDDNAVTTKAPESDSADSGAKHAAPPAPSLSVDETVPPGSPRWDDLVSSARKRLGKLSEKAHQAVVSRATNIVQAARGELPGSGPRPRDGEITELVAHRLLDGDEDAARQLSHQLVTGRGLADPGASDGPARRQKEFQERFPEFWGVNGEKFAGRVEGHTENCEQSVIAAGRTRRNILSGDRSAGVTVPARGGKPMTIGEANNEHRLENEQRSEAVVATFEEVEAHLSNHIPGALGEVYIEGRDGKVHAVMVERAPDGPGREGTRPVQYLDPHRGIVPDVGPHNVRGYRPLPDLGTTPMAGHEKLPVELLVGAPATAEPVRASELLAIPGVSKEHAFGLVLDKVAQDVRAAAADGGVDETVVDDLSIKHGIDKQQVHRVVEAAAMEKLREARGDVDAKLDVSAAYGIGFDQLFRLEQAAAVADLRESADRGRPHTDQELAARYGRDLNQESDAEWINEVVFAAMLADARDAVRYGGQPYPVREMGKRYRVPRQRARTPILTEAALREDPSESEVSAQLIHVSGLSRVDVEGTRMQPAGEAELQARAAVRAAVANKKTLSADELARDFGQPVEWAKLQINVVAHGAVIEAIGARRPYTIERLDRDFGLGTERARALMLHAPALEEVGTRAAKEAAKRSAKAGDPLTAEQLSALFGISVASAEKAITQAARSDILGRARRNAIAEEELAKRHGKSIEWAGKQIDANVRESIVVYAQKMGNQKNPETFLGFLKDRFGITEDRYKNEYKAVVEVEHRRAAWYGKAVVKAEYRRAALYEEEPRVDRIGRYLNTWAGVDSSRSVAEEDLRWAVVEGAPFSVEDLARLQRGDLADLSAEKRKEALRQARQQIDAFVHEDLLASAENNNPPLSVELLAQRHGITPSEASDHIAAAAQEYASAAWRAGGNCSPNDLTTRFYIDLATARRYIRKVEELSTGSDDGLMLDTQMEFEQAQMQQVTDESGVVLSWENVQFGELFPELWGVNAPKYVAGESGHEWNCPQSLVAAVRTLDRNRSGHVGDAILAESGGPQRLGWLAEQLSVSPKDVVAGSYEDVVRHLGGAGGVVPGYEGVVWGGVVLWEQGAPVGHVVLVRRSVDEAGRPSLMPADAHRGVVPKIVPRSVLGYFPIPGFGSTPMVGKPLDPNLPVGAGGSNPRRTSGGMRAPLSRDRGILADRPELIGAEAGGTTDQVGTEVLAEIRNAAKEERPYTVDKLVEERGLSRETARKAIRAAAHAAVEERVRSRDPYTVRGLADGFGISIMEAKHEIESAALAKLQVPRVKHSPDGLAVQYGLSRRRAFELIGKQVRTDASRFTIDALAERFGISPRAVEFHLRTENDPDGLADVRTVRDWILTEKSLKAGGILKPTKGGSEIGALDIAPGTPPRLDVVMSQTGLPRDQALFVVAENLINNRFGRQNSAAELAEKFGIRLAEAEVLIDTEAEFEILKRALVRNPPTPESLGAEYRKDSAWGSKRMESAIVQQLLRKAAVGGKHVAEHLHVTLSTRRLGLRDVRRPELVAEAVRADVRVGVGRGEPFTVAELAAKYGMPEAWCADQISVVMQGVVRAGVVNGGPRGVEGLAVEFGVDVAVAEEAVAAVVLGEVRAARAREESVDVASVARRYGIGREVVDRRIDAVMRADVRDAAIRRDPYTVAQLAEKYEVDESRALAQIEAAALAHVHDAARAGDGLTTAQVTERFGQGDAWSLGIKRRAAAEAIRAVGRTGRPITYEYAQDRYAINTDDIPYVTKEAILPLVREAAMRSQPYTRQQLFDLFKPYPQRRPDTPAEVTAWGPGDVERWSAEVIHAAARMDAWDALLGQGEPITSAKLAERYGIYLEDARDQVARVAREYLRVARGSMELPFEPGPHDPEAPALAFFRVGRGVIDSDTAGYLVARLGIGDGDAGEYVPDVDESLDTDTESVLDDEDDITNLAEALVRDVVNEPLDADTEFVLDGQDYIANLEEGRVGLAARLAGYVQNRPERLDLFLAPENVEFLGRFPVLWGVNAPRHVAGVEGHSANCPQSLVAAVRTLKRNRSGYVWSVGDAIPAASGGPQPLSWLAVELGVSEAVMVEAKHDQVVE
ncbi:DnaJ domain-containing protein, partial [Amycolatopsis sp. NPDC059027]|uniref:DnaJ domain-containing protein n=1 Tax=Amycolatopsis sp. NPDC059027 TaxID=3346709 RepID=UPI003670404C